MNIITVFKERQYYYLYSPWLFISLYFSIKRSITHYQSDVYRLFHEIKERKLPIFMPNEDFYSVCSDIFHTPETKL